jgi:hypothetical protein
MKSMNPNDLGSFLTVENIQKIKIDDVVRSIKGELKESLVNARLEALGVSVALTTSATGYGGKRLWFMCPLCNNRVGVLFNHPIKQLIGCRKCLSIRYAKQRYKGMIEADITIENINKT